jgi:hypothetical protein
MDKRRKVLAKMVNIAPSALNLNVLQENKGKIPCFAYSLISEWALERPLLSARAALMPIPQ